MILEELKEHLISIELKEKGEIALLKLLTNLKKDKNEIDGYKIDNLKYVFNCFEVRFFENDFNYQLIAHYKIYLKDERNSVVGYYNHIVGLEGDFLDEFFVIE